MKNLRPVVVVVRERGSSLPAARVGSSVLPSSCARVLSYWGGIAFSVGGIGFFPFIKPRFHLPPRFGSSIAIGEDKVQAAVMPPAPGYFLL